jgi:hypothetical protein
MKLILRFNVIPLDFNAPVPVFHKFFFFFQFRQKSFLVAYLTNFAQRQFLERIVIADDTWHHYEPESKAQSMVWKCPTSPEAKKFKSTISR